LNTTLVIKGGDVLHAGRMEQDAGLLIEGSRVAAIGRTLDPAPGTSTIDATGLYVLPGLIDIHTHGMRDVWVDRDDIHKYARYQIENGVTACLPTLAGNAGQDIARMSQILAETKDFSLTPNFVGFRPEILYLVDASAGDSKSLARPEPALTESLWEASGGRIRVWDVSPEVEGAIPFIEWCVEHDVVASMAHSNATVKQLRTAIDAGLSLITHLYDLFPMPVEIDEGVYPAGITDYINIEDRLTAEIIPDGVHVDPMLLEKTLRCKGISRVILITDSLKGSGNLPGEYDGLVVGDGVIVTADRGIRRKSDDILSGSAITAITGFRNAVMRFGRSVPEAAQLCSGNAARLLGLKKKGRLAAGMDADIILLDRDLRLKMTIVGGKVLYQG
jgi:N-acetylglucosamine-6-phosphate deacetylase